MIKWLKHVRIEGLSIEGQPRLRKFEPSWSLQTQFGIKNCGFRFNRFTVKCLKILAVKCKPVTNSPCIVGVSPEVVLSDVPIVIVVFLLLLFLFFLLKQFDI